MGLFSKTIKPVIRFAENLFNVPAVVLLYHRVDNLQTDLQQLAVSPKHFDEQIAFLRANYNLITIDEFYTKLHHKSPFDPDTIILTFDDGYADNYTQALPILEKHAAQALFYITTSKLNTKEILWWDALEYIFVDLPNLPDSLELSVNGREYTFDTKPLEKYKTYNKLHPLIKYTHFKERNRIMKGIYNWARIEMINTNKYRLLTHEELKVMAKSGSCVVGAHTLDHPVLSELSFDEQYLQILHSKKELENLTGKEIKHFSYPFGSKRDYNKDSIEACRRAGFEMVTSNFEWQVHSYTSKFEIPRYLVRDWNVEMFSKQMRNFFNH